MEIVHETKIENGVYKESLDVVNDWFLMGSPVPTVLILSAYLLFVLKIGPELMKRREPFKLQTVLLVYNAVQVYVSMRTLKISHAILSVHGLLPKTCVTENSDVAMQLATGIHFYFLVKVAELLDTVFFVLRKKYNQVTFLHVYHHVHMVYSTWVILKYDPSFLVTYLGWINSLVHVIMYTYYGLAAFPSLRKYLWWKKYITTFQILQFVSIIVHYFLLYKTSDCAPSTFITVSYSINLTMFIYLFGKFYFNNYMKRNKNIEHKEDLTSDIKSS